MSYTSECLRAFTLILHFGSGSKAECPRVSQGPHISRALTSIPGVGSGQEGHWNSRIQSSEDFSHVRGLWATATKLPLFYSRLPNLCSHGAFALDGISAHSKHPTHQLQTFSSLFRVISPRNPMGHLLTVFLTSSLRPAHPFFVPFTILLLHCFTASISVQNMTTEVPNCRI